MSKGITFRKPYDEHDRFYINAGSQIEDVYGYEINKYGQKELVKTGEHNIYEMIQESLEETKIENILQRVAMGDNSVMRPDGIYADLTEAPKNLLEARQQMQQLENVWNGLSNDIKREYNFSLDEFIGNAGSEKWLKDMGLINETSENIPSPQLETTTEGGNE